MRILKFVKKVVKGVNNVQVWTHGAHEVLHRLTTLWRWGRGGGGGSQVQMFPCGHLPRCGGARPLPKHHVGESLVLVGTRQRLPVSDLGQALQSGTLKALSEVTPGGGGVHGAAAVVGAGGDDVGRPAPLLTLLPLQDLRAKALRSDQRLARSAV
jgi:hypothetical protein